MGQVDVGLIPPLLSVYFGVCLSLFSCFRGRLKREAVLFTLLCLLSTMRPAQYLLQYVVTDAGMLMRLEKGILAAYAMMPFVGILFFHGVLNVRRPRLELGVLGCSLVMAAASLGPWLLSGLYTYPWGGSGKAGPFFPFFIAYAVAAFAYTGHCTVTAMRAQKDAAVRLKQRYLFVSLLGGAILLLLTTFSFFGNPMYPTANFVFVPLGGMAYGVMRHRILDIGTVAHLVLYRVVCAVMFLVPNILFFGVIRPLFDDMAFLPLALLLAFWYAANYFCTLWLHPGVSRRFNRYKHGLRTAESQFARDLLILRDTRSLVAEFGELVRSTLSFETLRFFFASVDEPSRLVDLDGEAVSLGQGATGWLVASDCLIDRYVLGADSLGLSEGVRCELLGLVAEGDGACGVPLVQYGQLIGFVAFAGKQGGASVAPVEVAFLEKVSRYLAIALYNSRVYQAVTSVKDQLELRRRELSREILERRRAEESLRRSERRYQLLADNILDTLVVVGAEHQVIQYASPSCLKLTGYAPAELVGTRLGDHLTESSGRELARLLPPLAEGGAARDAFMVELEHTRKDGTSAWVEVSGHFISPGDGPLEVVGVARDISERRVAEMEKEALRQKLRQAQKMESIGVLAGGIAHDFNNILMAILGYAQLGAMYLGEAEGKAAGFVDQIEKAALRAKELVSQILAFSRQDEQARRAVDVVGIAREALALMRPVIPKAATLQGALPDAPAMVMADPVQVHQIVTNLCTNAFHALDESAGGQVRVTVKSTSLDAGEARRYGVEPGAFVLLRVADPGDGMDDEVRSRIFEPYFTTKGKGKGTGMGLAVVQGIVLSHGGAVVVESEAGCGTTVDVYLPEVQGVPAAPAARADGVTPCGGRVLFVDDEPMLVELAGETLSRMGFDVVAMNSPEGALACFTEDPNGFDVVVTDMTMPHMSGLKLTEGVRSLNATIPVILCTGFSSELVGRDHGAMGVSAVLFKPVPMKELAGAIQRVRSGQGAVPQESPAP